jgi:FixJ family two-component response regulator
VPASSSRRRGAFLKIAVIDDDKSVRTSLARAIKTAGIEVASFSTADEFLNDPCLNQIDCAITDVRMPGIDGLALQEMLARTQPHLSLVFITGQGDIPMGIKAMKRGAVDFLEKPVDRKALLEAVHRAAERSRDQKASRAEIDDLQRRYELLTPRERQVFQLVTSGLLNKQASVELGTSEQTIKVHRAHAMFKMEAESLADLVAMAERLGVRLGGTDFSRAKGKLPQ